MSAIELPSVAEFATPPDACLMGYRGSVAHGMYVPNSDPLSIDDVDLMGVVLPSAEYYLGLREWGSRGTKEIKQGHFDCVLYEYRKFVSLLLRGNPNVLAFLWMEQYHYLPTQYHDSEAGRELIENRSLFIGKHVYNAFAGYAHAQLEKMETREPAELRQYIAVDHELKYRGLHPNHKGEAFPRAELETGQERDVRIWADDKLRQAWASFHKKGENLGYLGDKRKRLVLEHGYDAKNAAHCIRLLRMAKEFLSDGEMRTFRADADELLDIKKGRWTLPRVKQYAEELFSEIRIARDASPLPLEPDRAGVERFLIRRLRLHLLFRACASGPDSKGPDRDPGTQENDGAERG